MWFRIKSVVSVLDDRTLVALVSALSGGSVPEHVVRDQARRMRRQHFDPRDKKPLQVAA